MKENGKFGLSGISLPSLLFLLAFSIHYSILFPSTAQASGTFPLVKGQQLRPVSGSSPESSMAGELDAVSDSAQDIFEQAAAGKTERIGKKLEALKKSVAALGYPQNQSGDVLSPRLGHTVVALEQAWIAKDRLDIMRYANRITLIAATLAVPLKPGVPTEVSILEYNCRELAIWSETKRTEKLSNVVMRMHLTWQTLMPKLVEHNGIKELRRFSETMGRLETARTPEDYARLSRQASAEINNMKTVFAKPAK